MTTSFQGRHYISSNRPSEICTVETNKSLPKTTLYPISLRLPHHIHYLPHSSVVFMFVCQSWVLDFYSHTHSIVHVAFILHCKGGRIHFFLIIGSNIGSNIAQHRHSYSVQCVKTRMVESGMPIYHCWYEANDASAGNQRKSIQYISVFLQEETKEF